MLWPTFGEKVIVVMALLVQALFEGIERLVVPKGLRLKMST